MAEKFYKMPKILFGPDYVHLSSDAKMLYMLLADRYQLSVINGWHDASGETYCYFKREDMMTLLGVSAASVRKIMKQLQEAGLIKEKRQGFGKPNLIYLESLAQNTDKGNESDSISDAEYEDKSESSGKNSMEESADMQDDDQSAEIYQSGVADCDLPEGDKLSPNKTEGNKTNTIKTETESISISDQNESTVYRATAEDWSHIFYHKFGNAFEKTIDEGMVNSMIELMSEVMVSEKKEIKVSGVLTPLECVKSRLAKLTLGHIQYVIHSIRSTAVKIYNYKAYLLTCLYESFTTMDIYYINTVNCALAGSC